MPLLLIITIFSCSDDKELLTEDEVESTDDGSQGDTSSDIEPTDSGQIEESMDCEVNVLDINPMNGQEEVYYRSPIVVTLSQPDDTANIIVEGPNGTISGTTTSDGSTIQYFSDSSLVPSSVHNVSVEYCNGSVGESYTFATSELGTQLENSIDGNTYPIDFGSGTWVQPLGIGPIIAAQLQNTILLGIQNQNNDELGVVVGASLEGSFEQDFCFPIIGGIPGMSFDENPYFQVPETDIDLNISGFDVNLYNFSLSGVFSSDGSEYSHGVLDAIFDARDIALTVSLSAEDLCSVVAGLESPCKECPNDGQSFCIDVLVEGLFGTTTGETLECVSFANCHPECLDSSCPNPEQGICE
jgi:hypothetical protein